MINPDASPHPVPGTVIGAWEVLRPVGRGGMAVVYEVRRTTDQKVGAMKMCLPGGNRVEVEERFRREHRAMSRLHHPNIVRVFDAGTWEERAWYVMELLVGRDLRDEVQAWDSLEPEIRFERARRVAVDLARALRYIHAAGVVHRDLTPGNVIVRPDGSAVLMDFGVAKESAAGAAEGDLTAHGELLGTVAWIAPEQINGGEVDARTDLYALGALLYLMLTGRRPFHARTLAGYLDKHLNRPPRPPREISPQVPVELDEICMRLLQKSPDDRYSSATHLLHAIEGPPRSPVDLTGWPAEPVGRLAEHAVLAAAAAACADGVGGVIVVEGPHGVGKTTCLRAVEQAAKALGLRTHRLAGGGDPDALEVFRPLVEALLAETNQRHPVLDALLGAGGDNVTIERFAAFAAVRSLLVDTPPRLVMVDNVHLADAASLELLEYLLRNTRALGADPLLWVLARTPGEGASLAHILEGGATGARPTTLALGALSAAAVEELVGSLVPLDGAARALARRLHREAEGNPAFVVEMIRGLVEEHVVTTVDGTRGLALDEAGVARASLPIPRSAREALAAQVRKLGEGAQAVLHALAVARAELALDALGQVLGRSDNELLAAIEDLVAAGLARERRVEASVLVDVARVRARDAIYRELPEAERARLHRALGEALERLGRKRLHLVLDALARHFDLGDVPGKAYPYLLRSGCRLMDRSFVREALAAFDRAVALEPDARELVPLDDADRALCELLLKRAEALEHLGDWHQLDADLQRARGLAEALGDDRLLGRAGAAAGRRARQSGDLDAAETHFQAAMTLAERAGDHALRSFVMNQLGVVRWSRGDLEGARRHWVEGLAIAEGARDERSIGYGYNGLGMVAACKGQSAEARRAFEQAAAVFERVGLLAPLTWVRGNLVETHVMTGNLRRGLELAEKTLAQARELNNVPGIVLGRASYAEVLIALGREEHGRVEASEALELAGHSGDGGEVFTALLPLARAALVEGDDDEVLRLADQALAVAADHDHEGWAAILHAWKARGLARRGEPDAARAAAALALDAAGPRWPYQEVRLDLALARVHVDLGDTAEAYRRADAALRRADACGYRLYVLEGHQLAAACTTDDAAAARHRRVADALGRALAANLSPADAERFLAADRLRA